MTKRERAQVVELLRCAADLAAMGDRSSALGVAAGELDRYIVPGVASVLGGDGHWSALLGDDSFVKNTSTDPNDLRVLCGTGYEFCLLEAAQRIEDGWSPTSSRGSK